MQTVISPGGRCHTCLALSARALQLRFHSRVLDVDLKTGTVTLERPLPFNVSTAWTPEVHTFSPGIQMSGIEDMRIEFT